MRPQSLEEFRGQDHLTGPGKVIRKMVENNRLHSMILWGPPGVGKTTLATILARQMELSFFSMSAVNAGVKDVRQVLDSAAKLGRGLLFIDEIHRFNKAQQDSLLHAVEKGTVILIGATTENPSFEVISPLLSRCQTYVLKSLDDEVLLDILNDALTRDVVLQNIKVDISETEVLLRLAGGDARKLYNLVEMALNYNSSDHLLITNQLIQEVAQQKMARYDKKGEQHYDIISAFIKSIRGSDPNGALYWLARMTDSGEDPKFIARRLLILASEDIGNANPTALVLANACFDAVERIGYPECVINLSHVTAYLAASPKSNATYKAFMKARDLVKKHGDLPVPLHLRNAPTRLMKEIGYGKNYKYAHSYEDNFVDQETLPVEISGTTIYEPGHNVREDEIRKRLRVWWQEKYGY